MLSVCTPSKATHLLSLRQNSFGNHDKHVLLGKKSHEIVYQKYRRDLYCKLCLYVKQLYVKRQAIVKMFGIQFFKQSPYSTNKTTLINSILENGYFNCEV